MGFSQSTCFPAPSDSERLRRVQKHGRRNIDNICAISCERRAEIGEDSHTVRLGLPRVARDDSPKLAAFIL